MPAQNGARVLSRHLQGRSDFELKVCSLRASQIFFK